MTKAETKTNLILTLKDCIKHVEKEEDWCDIAMLLETATWLNGNLLREVYEKGEANEN